MATTDLEKVLNRAISDPAFRKLLFSNAQQALAGFSLTAEERRALSQITPAGFETYASATPEQRRSMGLTSINHTETMWRA